MAVIAIIGQLIACQVETILLVPITATVLLLVNIIFSVGSEAISLSVLVLCAALVEQKRFAEGVSEADIG